MEGDRGIEPRLAAPKTAVFPLDESPLAEGEGIEPPNPLRSTVFETASSTNRTPSIFDYGLFTRFQKDMAVRAGIEPTFPGSESGVLPLDDPTVDQMWFRGLELNQRRVALQATALPLSYLGMIKSD